MYTIGVDGGGSTIRVVIMDENLTTFGTYHAPISVNPVVAGRDIATQRIKDALWGALTDANLSPDDINVVTMGIAGSINIEAELWLEPLAKSIFPHAKIFPSSDMEIALVAAHGKREGVMVLAGTGSVSYGINAQGDSLQVGGWGYLLGDEGGGFWLGMQALKAIINTHDERAPQTRLTDAIFEKLAITSARQLVNWLYYTDVARTAEIATFAPLILEQARAGDAVSQDIIKRGAEQLELLVKTTITRLNMDNPPIGFVGGLLTNPTLLSEHLCQRLGLTSIPAAKHTPVVGAALLGLIRLEN